MHALSGPTCPARVSFESCAFPLSPSPCGRLSRPRSTMRQSDSPWIVGRPPLSVKRPYPLWTGTPLLCREPLGSPKFLPLLCMHTTPCDDHGGPSGISPVRRQGKPCKGADDSFVLASSIIRLSPTASIYFDEAALGFGECGLPCGLHASLCTLHAYCSALRPLVQKTPAPPPRAQHSVRVAG